MAALPAKKLDPAPAHQVTQGTGDEGVAAWERFFAGLSREDQATLDGLAALDRTYGADFEREARERASAPDGSDATRR